MHKHVVQPSTPRSQATAAQSTPSTKPVQTKRAYTSPRPYAKHCAKPRSSPSDLDAIFAHATGTPQGDFAETAALTLALAEALPQIPVVALKAALGHALGAAGAIQVIAAIKALVTQVLPPTLNVEERDPACGDLRIVPTVCAHRMQWVLSNASGFGGHNVGLVVGRGFI